MKVLAIDDQPEVLKQIKKAISEAKGPDGRNYEVEGLTDHQAALRRLDEERFDVVVTDMAMGNQETEGLPILEKLTGKSPIMIVLTAYPSIPNCVASMRAGAWDYIEKTPADGSDAYSNLLKSLDVACRERLAHPDAGRMSSDAVWVREHMDELVAAYPGKVVAVLDAKVVGSDESYEKLTERLKPAYPYARPTILSVPDTTVEAVE